MDEDEDDMKFIDIDGDEVLTESCVCGHSFSDHVTDHDVSCQEDGCNCPTFKVARAALGRTAT